MYTMTEQLISCNYGTLQARNNLKVWFQIILEMLIVQSLSMILQGKIHSMM